MVDVGKWSFFVGVLLAILAGFFTIPYIAVILVILGLIVGFLNITDKVIQPYLVAVIALLLIGTASLQALSVFGEITEVFKTILSNLISFVAASGLIVALKAVLQLGK